MLLWRAYYIGKVDTNKTPQAHCSKKEAAWGTRRDTYFHCCQSKNKQHCAKKEGKKTNIGRKIPHVCKMSVHLEYFFLLSELRAFQKGNTTFLVVPLVSKREWSCSWLLFESKKEKLRVKIASINEGKQNYKIIKRNNDKETLSLLCAFFASSARVPVPT